MAYYGACEKCGRAVDTTAVDVTERRPAFPVTGWETLRSQGGANQIRNRQRVPNRVRHEKCIPRPDENEDQEALL